MKRGISLLLTLAVLLSCLGGFAFAADGIKVVVDNTAVNWPDAKPFVDDNGRTLVPLRPVAEAMGMTVEWDSANGIAIFHGDLYYNGAEARGTMEFPIGKATATFTCAFPKTGAKDVTETVEMDTAAVVVNDRTYAPVRYLAEAFGYAVDWEGKTGTVGVYSDSEVCDATLLVRGNLNLFYHGVADPAYLALTNQTAAEAKGYYEQIMSAMADWFADYFDIVNVTPEVKEELTALMKEVFAKTDFSVDCGVRVSSTEITAKAHVRPLNVFEVMNDRWNAGAFDAFFKKYEDVDVENMSDAEYAAYDREWADNMMALCREVLQDAPYLPEQTMDVHVTLTGGYWVVNSDDVASLGDLALSTPTE